MRIGAALRLLVLPAVASLLQACLGTAGPSSPAQPPLLTLSADSPSSPSSEATPEQARTQAVAEIRAKAQAHNAQHESAPFPDVFTAQGPQMTIASQQKSRQEIEAELAGVRSELKAATDPKEAAALQRRMAELLKLGRTHAQQSEQQIQANSERMR